MLSHVLELPGRPLNLLCIGAHSDDLEIGCAGTVLKWLRQRPGSSVTWVVLAASGERAREARRSASALLRAAANRQVVLGGFTDSNFPGEFKALKNWFEQLKRSTQPDVILTHRLEDRHQDHRTAAELTWQTWRNHLVLEYEIPKFEGDLGQPNLYVPLPAALARRKVEHLMRNFGTQRSRAWFQPQTFEGLMQLRAIECRAAEGFAEAFSARKLVL